MIVALIALRWLACYNGDFLYGWSCLQYRPHTTDLDVLTEYSLITD